MSSTIYQYKPAVTPEQIANEGLFLNIPIYQRLFVWEEEQINLLLDDLFNAFKKTSGKSPYYIGIITLVKNTDKWDVVDGQQRLTFLSLFGAYLCSQDRESIWKNFLFRREQNLRIEYMGRPDDSNDLKRIATGDFVQIKNANFRLFVECIKKKRFAEMDCFSEYIYRHASFLISELPVNYAPEDLNLFFEKMNATGRQLTAVEQIKGKYFPAHALAFDACLNFDKAWKSCEEQKLEGPELSLADILTDNSRQVKPESQSNRSDVASRSVLSAEVFLLHCLEISGKVVLQDERKILETFNKYVGTENGKLSPEKLLETMRDYRKWLDDNIIYLKASSDGSWEYAFRREDDTEEEDSDEKDRKLRQFQSMLYVSDSNYQHWVLNAYLNREEFSLDWLKKQDNAEHQLNPDNMTYSTINRYWFWKLDYLLWEQFDAKKSIDGYELEDEEIIAIRNYKFRRNRSIEHLHPQTDGDIEEWKDAKHQFGNLAMISSSFNSLQQNDTIGVKFARLKDTQIPQKSLESIKLLLMFALANRKEDGWTTEKAQQHGVAMYELLEQFHNTSNQNDQGGQG